MFDAKLRPWIDPPLNRIGRALAARGITANAVTAFGLAVGLLGAVAIANGLFLLGLALIAANRLLDGLDGAIARTNGPTDLGGYFDIVADFAFYVSIPVAFGFVDPANALASLVLTACFVLTGTSFLAYAVIAEKRKAQTVAHGQKSFFYSTGLAEGTETILFFVAMTIFPAAFVVLAYAFAALCVATVIQRSILAAVSFAN